MRFVKLDSFYIVFLGYICLLFGYINLLTKNDSSYEPAFNIIFCLLIIASNAICVVDIHNKKKIIKKFHKEFEKLSKPHTSNKYMPLKERNKLLKLNLLSDDTITYNIALELILWILLPLLIAYYLKYTCQNINLWPIYLNIYTFEVFILSLWQLYYQKKITDLYKKIH